MKSFSRVMRNVHSATLIGSRKPPKRISDIAVKIGRGLSDMGVLGYSGGAIGMDNQFMFDYSTELRRIIIPKTHHNGLVANGRDIIDYRVTNALRCEEEVLKVAENYYDLDFHSQELYNRNVMQVLRETVDNPTDVVIFWAPEIGHCVQGGTKIAVMIARKYKIPCFNLWREEVLEEVCEYFKIPTRPPTLDFLC